MHSAIDVKTGRATAPIPAGEVLCTADLSGIPDPVKAMVALAVKEEGGVAGDVLEFLAMQSLGDPLPDFCEGIAPRESTGAEREEREAKRVRFLASVDGATPQLVEKLITMVDACTVALDVPKVEVTHSLETTEPVESVSWEDGDGDTVTVMKKGDMVVYAVNGEERPPLRQVDVASDGTSLDFPELDRAVDLPPGGSKEYIDVLRKVRAIAAPNTTIPPTLTLRAQAHTQHAVIPHLLRALPHSPHALPPTVTGDSVTWVAHRDLAPGDPAEVNHFPKLGNHILLHRYGLYSVGNPDTCVILTDLIPARKMGAPETAEDVKYGLVLQAAHNWAEAGLPVSVFMPDVELLEKGQDAFFSIEHRLTLDCPVPVSLIGCAGLTLADNDTVDLLRKKSGKDEVIQEIVDALDLQSAGAILKQRIADLLGEEEKVASEAPPSGSGTVVRATRENRADLEKWLAWERRAILSKMQEEVEAKYA